MGTSKCIWHLRITLLLLIHIFNIRLYGRCRRVGNDEQSAYNVKTWHTVTKIMYKNMYTNIIVPFTADLTFWKYNICFIFYQESTSLNNLQKSLKDIHWGELARRGIIIMHCKVPREEKNKKAYFLLKRLPGA